MGERLAVQVLHDRYGYDHIVPCGPVPLAAVFANEKATVYFDYGKDLHASEGNVAKTFELAGPDGIFYPAEVTVKGEGKLTVTATPMVKEATSVRYGWQPFTRANLVNGAGLPTSTFRFDKK